MPRRKADNTDELLTHNIIIRVTETLFNKLEKLRVQSKQLSIAEICRKILTRQQIKLYHVDITMNPVMEQLALIRKELRAIGVNINQITRSFNTDKKGIHYDFHIRKAAEEYRKVDERVEVLLSIVSRLAEKWLQE